MMVWLGRKKNIEDEKREKSIQLLWTHLEKKNQKIPSFFAAFSYFLLRSAFVAPFSSIYYEKKWLYSFFKETY